MALKKKKSWHSMLQKIISRSNLGVGGLMNPVNQEWLGVVSYIIHAGNFERCLHAVDYHLILLTVGSECSSSVF